MKKIFIGVMTMSLFLVGCGSHEDATGVETQSESKQVASTVSPDSAIGAQQLIEQGKKHLNERDVPLAIKNFHDAIVENPRGEEAYLILGQTYMELQSYDRAIETLSALTKVDPGNGKAYYLLAVANGMGGHKELAKKNAQMSVEIFQGKKDQENFLKSLALLQGLLKSEKSEDAK